MEGQLTCSSLLPGPGGVLHQVGGVQQGPAGGHAVLLPPSLLAGMSLIGVTPQVMTCNQNATNIMLHAA